jgi:hypothetical protein
LALLTAVPLVAALATWRALPAPQARSVPLVPDAADARPGLTLALETLDLGCLEPLERHEIPVAWRRVGPGDLRVLALRTGCGCAALCDLPTTLPAGAHGTLRVVLHAPGDHGPLDIPLRVVTDARAPGDVSTLRVVAFVGDRIVVRPAYLDLGRRSAGAGVSTRLCVHLPPGAQGPVEASLSGWPGDVRVVRAAMHAQRGPDLLLDTACTAPPGPRAGLLRVRAAGGGAVAVPLRMDVAVPPVPRAPPAPPEAPRPKRASAPP